MQRGYEVHVVDLATEGPKRDLVEALGAHYHAGDAADVDADVDVVIECTGLGAVGRSAAQRVVSGGIMCLTGIMNVEPQFDSPVRALITGAGPIGLLGLPAGECSGAMSGCTSSTWLTEGPKLDLVEALGAHYHPGDAADLDAEVDVVIECTGLGGSDVGPPRNS